MGYLCLEVFSLITWYLSIMLFMLLSTCNLTDGGSALLLKLEFMHCEMHLLEEHKELKINWRRVATTTMFGLGFVGPVGHYWYEGLDRIIRVRLKLQPNSFRFVASKVAADGIIFGPLDLLVFFTYMGFSSGKSTAQVKEDVKRDFLPALVLEGAIWPAVQVVNFRFVPVRNQLLYVNLFCLLDSCFLSWIEQQEDAPWKRWLKSRLSFKEGQGG
ncbi:protein SYM1-like isoform X1 [Salvia splendens]|uniref:protein SYM1-like isoform X1 n=1 Tax=Salvia splendens TaxID=180675 RepID=UPI001C251C3A|nr:protein SYM1-like isoform X1 [Salvia splendens]XP_041995482.1 protein SYM1-like isoform X1 [Salvia splendens]